jgi:predicted RNA-binding Zn ribbon-like protein
MRGAKAENHRFDLDGGTIALDFVNTVSGFRGGTPRDRIQGYDDLVYWALQAGVLDDAQARRLYAEASAHPRRAAEAHARAIAAREGLHDVLFAALERRVAPSAALEAVNRWIAEALSHRRVRPTAPGRFETVFEDDGDLLAFLRPVAADALRVIEAELAQDRVRICDEVDTGNCGWVFLDETKNQTRRYCSAKDCGNRAKQRRHRMRQRGA